MTTVGESLLRVTGLVGGYGSGRALHGVDFDVAEGQIVSLLGRNGAGKTTTLRALMGLLPDRAGSVQLQGRELINLGTRHIARSGLAYCPEERAIFATLSVQENLFLPPVLRSGGMSVDRIYEYFPNLKERASSQGTKLSGGEQQMLAIARILRTGARFLLLDEPTEGLAPVIVNQIGVVLKALRDEGYTILMVEQNFRFAQKIADNHLILETGRIVDRLSASDLASNPAAVLRYLEA